MSSVGNEGRRDLKPSLSDTNHDLADRGYGSQTFQPLSHSTIAQVRQGEADLEKRCSPEEPQRQAEAGHKLKDENVSPRDATEMVQGTAMLEKNLEHFAMHNLSRDIFKTEELFTLQARSCEVLTTSELESSKMINVNLRKVEAALTTEHPSTEILVPQDFKLSDPKRQLLSQLKLNLEREKHIQAQECPTDMSLTSNSLTSKASLTQSQNVCCGDMGVSQVLHVHLEDNKISPEQQESWHSKQVLGRCQPMSHPQRKIARKVRPQGIKAGKCRSEDSGGGTSVARKKSHHVEDRKLDGASSSLSQNELFPPESFFRKKMRQFIQWIKSMKNTTKQESCWHQDPSDSVSALVSGGPPEARELMTAIGKILEEKVTCRYESEVSELSQQKEELQAQVGPDKRHPSSYQAFSDTPHEIQANIEFCSQEAVSAEQNCLTSVRQDRHRTRIPQKIGAFKKQLLSWSQPASSPPSREPVPHPSPTCVHHISQVRPAILTADESTVFRDLTLLFKQKTLLQHFGGEEISLKKSFSPC
ncbi:spermatogenesis-associated protein 31D1-like [Crocuta crocuta]